jgi:CRP/FNR family transcriptional regulator, cyclic AMP receptor protein
MSLAHVTSSQLRGIPLFSELEDELLETVLAACDEVNFPRNTPIIREHDSSTKMYIIIGGRVKVSLIRPDNKEVILAILEAGEFFGDMSMFDDQPRSASVISIEPTQVLSLTRTNFTGLLGQHPEMIDKVLVILTRRLRSANTKIADLAFLDAIGRLANAICEIAEREGEDTPDGTLLRNRPSHDQLSHMVATTRETVTHCLVTLERRGYVVSLGRDLLVFSVDDLREAFSTPR